MYHHHIPSFERSESFYYVDSLDFDEYETFDMDEVEKEESKYLKSEQTAFMLSPDGNIATPFHLSITRFMKMFGFDLRRIFTGPKTREVYISDMSKTEDYSAILSYKIAPLKFTFEADLETETLTIDLVRDVYSLDPIVTFLSNENRDREKASHNIDIKDLILNYPQNCYPEAIIDFMTQLALAPSLYGKYIK